MSQSVYAKFAYTAGDGKVYQGIENLENRVSALENGVAQLAEAFSEPEPFLPENRELIGFRPSV